MAGDSLYVGDQVSLYSEEGFGYAYALQSR